MIRISTDTPGPALSVVAADMTHDYHDHTKLLIKGHWKCLLKVMLMNG